MLVGKVAPNFATKAYQKGKFRDVSLEDFRENGLYCAFTPVILHLCDPLRYRT